MITITTNDLYETMLESKLQRFGALDPISVDGDIEPAINVQLCKYDSNRVDGDERILSIICTGRTDPLNPNFVDTPMFNIIVAGKRDDTDTATTKLIALAIEQTLSSEPADSCDIFGVVTNGVQGPLYDETGRVIFEVNGNLSINKF